MWKSERITVPCASHHDGSASERYARTTISPTAGVWGTQCASNHVCAKAEQSSEEPTAEYVRAQPLPDVLTD